MGDGQGMGADGTLGEAWAAATLPSPSPESPGTVSWRFKVSPYIPTCFAVMSSEQ